MLLPILFMDGNSDPTNLKWTEGKIMNRTKRYFPEDLEWSVQGEKCRVRDINRMCESILTHGTVTDVHRHTAQSFDPNGTREVWPQESQAITIECDHLPGLVYIIHLCGFRVTEIIEMISFNGTKA